MFESWQLRDQLLNNFTKRLEDGMVIYTRKMKTKVNVFKLSISKLIISTLLNISLGFYEPKRTKNIDSEISTNKRSKDVYSGLSEKCSY